MADTPALEGAVPYEQISVGDTARFAKTVTEADILLFGAVSGDTNPVHFNEEIASQTMFKGRIAHGMLSAGFISTVLGTRLPGPGAIYMSQSLKFTAPVKPGDTVTATVEVIEKIEEKRRLKCKTTCTVGDTIVIDGEAMVWVPG